MKPAIEVLFDAAVEADLLFKIERVGPDICIYFGEVKMFAAKWSEIDWTCGEFIKNQLAKKQYGFLVNNYSLEKE